jgi:hypothetical protein
MTSTKIIPWAQGDNDRPPAAMIRTMIKFWVPVASHCCGLDFPTCCDWR